MKFSAISVVGLGYIGLPTAAVFASRKVRVTGVEIDPQTVETVNRGQIHIVEPDLDMLVHAAVREGYLRASLQAEPAEAFLIAVPTPFKDHFKPDLSFIKAACEAIAPVLRAGNLVVLESTVPVGSTEQLAAWLAALRPDLSFPHQTGESSDIRIAHCPERVLPGRVLRELVENDRVIGGMTPRCSARAAELYGIFVQGECVITDARTAEMCKLAENSFRDVNIAFANELSQICDKLGIDAWELIGLANRHPRVNILQPGPGVGGHCIAIDPWFIVDSAPDEARIIRKARQINDERPRRVIEQLEQVIGQWQDRNGGRYPSVAFLGLSYKPNIDDVRASPAVTIVNEIARRRLGELLAVEPHLEYAPSELDDSVRLVAFEQALHEADILVLLVAHKAFMVALEGSVTDKVVVDTCGAWKGIAI